MAVLGVSLAILAAACANGSSSTPPAPTGSAMKPFGFAAGARWHTTTTGMRVSPPQAPTAWATTLPTTGASAVDPWTTLIPRLGAQTDGLVIVATIYGDRHTAPRGLVREFPVRRLPLQLRNGVIDHRWEGMPSGNVAQLFLTARIRGRLVQVDGYFGSQHPSPRQLAYAQAELATLTIPAAAS